MEQNSKTRKTDRRTVITKQCIKDGMLSLLTETPFERITVSSLCRSADVGRATFYQHYDNLIQVIDELADDAIRTSRRSRHNDISGFKEAAEQLKKIEDKELPEDLIMLLPVCQRVAENPKYQPLFLDPFTCQYLLSQIYRSEKEHLLPQLIAYGLSEKQAEMIFWFALNGSFAVNTAVKWKRDDNWLDIQKALLTFMAGGYEALKDSRQTVAK